MLEASNPSKNHTIYSSSNSISREPLHPAFPERYEESFYNEMDHFVKVIQGRVIFLMVETHILILMLTFILCIALCETYDFFFLSFHFIIREREALHLTKRCRGSHSHCRGV